MYFLRILLCVSAVTCVLCAPMTDEERNLLRSLVDKLKQDSSKEDQTDNAADMSVPDSYPALGGEVDSPGHKFWVDLLHSLPSIKVYLENLDECTLLAKEYRIIEDNFPHREGDEESVEKSRIALCRFAFILHQLYNVDPEDVSTDVEQTQPSSADNQPAPATTNKRGFGFYEYQKGPLILNGRSLKDGLVDDNYYKRSADSDTLASLAKKLADRS